MTVLVRRHYSTASLPTARGCGVLRSACTPPSRGNASPSAPRCRLPAPHHLHIGAAYHWRKGAAACDPAPQAAFNCIVAPARRGRYRRHRPGPRSGRTEACFRPGPGLGDVVALAARHAQVQGTAPSRLSSRTADRSGSTCRWASRRGQMPRFAAGRIATIDRVPRSTIQTHPACNLKLLATCGTKRTGQL